LYYRLSVFPVRVPLLRERREDIPFLVEHFVQKFAGQMNRTITSIPKKTMETLMQWDWPGNVRELENFIERSVILTQGSVLAAPINELMVIHKSFSGDSLKAREREHILRALEQSRGQLSGPHGAAARLGLPRSTLQWKLKQLGIDHQQYRD
jgi:formate hydrogenlyase transcriptional activator